DAGKRRHDTQPGVFGDSLPQLDDGTDPRVIRKARIDLGLVRVLQHIHDMGAADTRRIVQAGIFETAGLQVLDATVGPLLHLVLRTEQNRLGRAGLLTGRPEANGHAVRAQRALVGRVIGPGDARDVERAAFDAVAAPDTVLVHEIHDPVRVLHDRPGR